jgi:hypothetical protein
LILCTHSHFVYADMLGNSLRQRIADYDIQMNTAPAFPIPGNITRVNLAFTTVSNNVFVDTPVTFQVNKDNQEILRTDPIILQGNHYQLPVVFKDPGTYELKINIMQNGIQTNPSSSDQVTFLFPIKVYDSFTLSISSLIIPIAISLLVLASLIVLIKKYKFLKPKAT